MTRIQLLFNDEASSSTLVEGLAPHDNKIHHNIKWIHKETKLTIKKRLQRPRHDKSRVFTLYGASQCRVYKIKTFIYNNKKKNKVSLPDHRECARSHLRCAQAHTCLQGSGCAALNNGTRVSTDVGMRSIMVACARAQMCSIAASVCSIALLGILLLCLFFTLKLHERLGPPISPTLSNVDSRTKPHPLPHLLQQHLENCHNKICENNDDMRNKMLCINACNVQWSVPNIVYWPPLTYVC